MLTNIDISEYIKVCTYLGSYNELIQGSGGNFSLKSDNEIIIKSSGRVLAETSNIYGYVICSLDKLNKSLIDKEISVNSCVLRGEQNGIPSMEVFFHLLPYKWVIHIHPTSFLVYLCQESWLTLRSTYSYCFIPYKTPGKDLGSSILEKFNDEQVFFLQNHGIIICANEIKEVYTILDDLYLLNIKNNICSIQKDEFVNIYSIKEYIEKKVEYTIVLKKCKNIKNIKDSFFHPITPDILLFLKKAPLILNHPDKGVAELIDIYYEKYNILPAVIIFNTLIYVCGKSHHQCISIEEILESYKQIIESCDSSKLIYFDEQKINSITSSENEIHRLNMA